MNEPPQSPRADGETPAAPSEIDLLKKELQTLGEKTEEYLAGWKRAAADYQNLQKETARDRETMVRFASEHLLRDLLPVLDHAKAAFGQMPETDNEMIKQWLAGAKHVFDGLKKTLKAHGLEEMPVMGEKFDPGRYETVGSRKEDGKEAGLVLEEARPGYLLHGKVLRPAQVIISE